MNQMMIRGNCLHRLATIASESIDAVVTDPPYGINLKLRSNRARPLSIKGDGRTEARQLWRDVLPELHRVARPDSAHLFFGTWKSIWMKELLEEHFTVKGCIVWYKNTWGYGWHLRPRWELIWLCHKGTPPIPSKAPPDVWEFKRDHRLQHPCQKPVALLRECIRLVVPQRGHVLDPFAGIGSTGVAAVEAGCAFTGIELDARYVRLGRQRLANAQAEMARFSRAARFSQTSIESTSKSRRTATCAQPDKSAPAQPAPVSPANSPSSRKVDQRHQFRA